MGMAIASRTKLNRRSHSAWLATASGEAGGDIPVGESTRAGGLLRRGAAAQDLQPFPPAGGGGPQQGRGVAPAQGQPP
jgi:hypothetical protein